MVTVKVMALMGLGEGVAFPTIQAIIKGWVPADKRSRSLSLVFSGKCESCVGYVYEGCILRTTYMITLPITGYPVMY